VGAALPPGDATPTETPAPEASATPEETAAVAAAATQAASETPANQAFITADVDTTVRFGPDPASLALGDLLAGSTAKVYGRDPDGLWWYVDYPPGTASRGWVFQASTTLTGDVNTIPVVNAVGTPVSGGSSGAGGGSASTGPTSTPQG
jgi:hypothetical protein